MPGCDSLPLYPNNGGLDPSRDPNQDEKTMSGSSIWARFPLFTTAVLAAALAFAGPAPAQRSGPFSGLAGSWAGGGSIAIGNGTTERIRCRAEYQVAGSGSTVGLELRCASDSYRFELQGNVRYQGGEVRGDWSEKTRGAAGLVSGRIKGDQIEVRVEGPNFVALLSLITRGDKQSISIKAPSGSWVSEANMTLNRRS
jgi:hypothetical protein